MTLLPEGGAALPVSVTTTRKVQGGAAIPVYGYMTAPTDGRPAMGGSAIPVRVLTAADLKQNGGMWTLEGRPYAMPVYTAPAGVTVLGGPALAVYPVNAWPTVPVVPPVPAWVPTDLAGLKLWLKADGTLWQDSGRTTPAVADTNPVGCWDDASGNANHVVQTTAGARPILKLNIQNGKPVVRFDSSGDRLFRTNTDFSAVVGADSATIFIVMMQVGAQANNTAIAWNGADATNYLVVYATYSNTIYWDYKNFGAGRISVAQPAGWDDAYRLLTLRRNAATASVIRVNGAALVNGTQAGTLTSVPTGLLEVGSANAGTLLCGDICELLVYNAALSDTDMGKVETYLNTRWVVY